MKRHNGKRSGFTIIEIMVVVVIIGILAALVLPSFVGRIGEAKSSVAKQKLANIEQAIELFYTDCGRYQEELDELFDPPSDLEDKWHPPTIKRKNTIDPWERPYIYEYPGNNGVYDVYSLGADGTEGGEGENADIVNW